jgi:iron complex outermembrane receptor protein
MESSVKPTYGLLHLKQHLLYLVLVVVAPAIRADPNTPTPANLKSLSLEELSQIEVTTPSRGPEKVMQTPAAVYVITNDEIKRSGATCIPEALRLAPGVEVARIDGSKWSVGIRGFGSRLTRDILVLIDGRTVYTTLLAGTYWEVQNTDMDDIDRIEVIRGPGGTIWGPNAVNGVINIITKNSAETRGLLASAGGGSYEQGFANFRYGGGNGDGFDYRVYGMGFTRAPEYHTDGRNWDDWRQTQGGFRMDWKKDAADTFTFQGDLYTEEAGENVGATSYTPPYSQVIDANAQLSGGNILGRWTRDLGNGDDIQIQMFYDRTNRHEPNLIDLRNTFDFDFLQHYRWKDRQRLTWGLGSRFSLGDDPPVVSGLTFTPNRRIDTLYSAFLQDEISLVPEHLFLTVGTKALRTNYTDFALEPSARLMWSVSNRQSLWMAFTHAVRTPSDAERDFNLSGYIGTTSTGVNYFARFGANAGFQPEQLNGSELGYRLLLGRSKKVYVDIATFFNHYHNLFSEDVIGTAFLEDYPPPPHFLLPAAFANDLRGYTKGGEIAPEWSPNDFWRLRGSYSYLHMNLEAFPSPGTIAAEAPGSVEGASPQHQATIENWFTLSKTVALDLTYRYVSALPSFDIPAYSTGDAQVSWRASRQLELSFVGQNLFQPHHYEFSYDPGPLVGMKRSVYAKITWMY